MTSQQMERVLQRSLRPKPCESKDRGRVSLSVFAIIKELNGEFPDSESDELAALGIDDLTLVEIAYEIEDVHLVNFGQDERDLPAFKTVKELVDFVHAAVEQKEAKQ